MSALIGIETLILAVIIVFLSASWHLYKQRIYYRNVTSKLPTLYGIPFIGRAYQFLDLTRVYKKIRRNFDSVKNLTVCVWVASTPFVVTVEPEVIKRVTSLPEFLNKSKDLYIHFQNGVLNGLIVSPAAKWKPDRKAISPFLAHSNIIGFFPCFNDGAINVKNKLERLAGQGEQDIFTIIKECGLQLTLFTIMGIEMEEGTKKHNEIVDALTAFLDHMAKNSVYSSVGLGFLSQTPHYKRVLKYLRDLVQSLIKENRAKNVESEDMNHFVEEKQLLIELAMKAVRQGLFSEKDVEIECFTMFAASFETSVSAAYTCLLMMAMHPELQERVFQEVRSVFPDGVTSVEYDDLKKLPYLDMFIAEVLRLAPPVPSIGRQAMQDAELCPGVMVPKDMQVIIPIYELHRRKEIWGPNADRFNPDNFLPENIAKRHPCAYMPFSKGSRNCIGFRYAEVSLRIIVLHVVRRLKFFTTFKYEDIVHVPKVTLTYQIEPRVSIEVRTN